MGAAKLERVKTAIQLFIQSDQSRLVQLSFLMLFVELTLIRWVGANVYYISLITNFVLLASFLGIGWGFLRSRSSANYFQFAPILLAIFVYACYQFSCEYHPVVDPRTNNFDFKLSYFEQNIYPVWITLPVIFLTVTVLMAALADGVARAFQKFSPLVAYRLEIIGSLLGTCVFSLLSMLSAMPLYWGGIIGLLFLSLLISQWQLKYFFLSILQVAALIVIVVVFAKDIMKPGHFWSPYYKIDVQEYSENRYVIDVNGLVQQVIESVEQRKKVRPFYFFPYQHMTHPTLNNVLIVGAGVGGDVAIALDQGAKHIDAVEIDPMLYKIGKNYNPDHPYSDPRVHMVINDGRAFLQQTSRKYDLIIFALTNSAFLIPGQSSLRLENYLYTAEAITIVSKHLTSNGVFAVYNYYPPRWVLDRMSNTLATVFKHPPCMDSFTVWDAWSAVLTISPESSVLQCPTLWELSIKDHAAPATDDHPFLYLMDNQIPLSYMITLLFILFTALVLVIWGANNVWVAMNSCFDLFLMGAAFLLLETKSVTTYALLFGTTWFVNALVFVGILLAVYLAIEMTHYAVRVKPVLLYGLLFAALLLSWCVPNSWLLSLPAVLRFVVATTLVFSPVFIANIIFADRFRDVASSTEALGINLLGAVFGGVLEYCALIVGYRNLLILIGLLYVMAILFMRQKVSFKTAISG